MGSGNYKEIKYCIFDPTGNITALVETEVEAADRPSVASAIMAAHPEVEQAGFVVFNDGADVPVSLMMAGGEFCGNATMCAAALYAMRRGLPADGAVKVKVSGAEAPLTVQLARQVSDGSASGASEAAGNETALAAMYTAAVMMPPAKSAGIVDLLPAATEAGEDIPEETGAVISLPLVRLQGIDHMIIEPDSGFFGLKDDPSAAETLIRECCGALGSDCLGMMFLDEPAGGEAAAQRVAQAAAQGSRPDAAEAADGCAAKTEAAAVARSAVRCMTPLVYVPGADTLFWENSCASGSAAAGIWLAIKAGSPVDVRLRQPAGSLRVESDPATGHTVLHGTARLLTQATYKC